jgi:hypothetical protein
MFETIMASKNLYLLLLGSFLLIASVGCIVATDQPSGETTQAALITGIPRTDPISLDETWVRLYGNGQESTGEDVIQAEDGSYFVVGGMSPSQKWGSIGGVMLLKINKSGDILWQKAYGGEGYDAGWAITEGHGGGFVLGGVTTSFGAGGMDGYLIMADEDGNEIWSKTFGGVLDESIAAVQKIKDGGYFLVGNRVDPNDFVADPEEAGYGGFAGRSNIFVVKTDGEGDEIWSHTLESPFNVLASAGFQLEQGGYFVLATVVYFPQEGDDLLLVMLDEDGNEVWRKIWEEGSLGGYTMLQDSEGNFIVTGLVELEDDMGADILLIKIDAQGNELWQRKIGDPGVNEIGRDIIETNSGDYALLVDKFSTLYSHDTTSWLLFLDKEGQLIQSNELDISYQLKSGSLIQDKDGALILTGGSISSIGRFQTILIRTDQDGHVRK